MTRFLPGFLALALLCTGCPGKDWQLVFEKLPSALTSVTGSGAKDVWTVGGDAGDGKGPLVLHYDGSSWKRLQTKTTGDLWWVHQVAPGHLLMGGANGLVLQLKDGVFTKQQTPGTDTVFGVWASAPDDAWAVGGDGTTHAFAWRWNGAAWTEAPGFPADLKNDFSLFKVWGRSSDDVTLVGSGGLVLHWNGKAFERQASDLASSERSLFTVHGTANRTAAVGGYASGVIDEDDGNGWRSVGAQGIPQLSGIFLTGDATGWAVGARMSVFERSAAGWQQQQTDLTVREDLHAVWADPSGGVWAVGGEVLTLPLLRGVLIHKGDSVSDSIDE